MDIINFPHWIGAKLIDRSLVSYLGKDPETIEMQILMGSYFFISKEKLIHEKQLYTIMSMIGDLGGVSVMCFNIASICAYYYSVNFFWGSLIHRFFFVYDQ